MHAPGDRRPELLDVAQATGLGQFFWFTLESRRGAFLLLTGFSSTAGSHGLMSPADLEHFELFANHLATLLNNACLIEALDQEKSELSESNALLDHSLAKLRESQAKLVESTRLLTELSRRAGMADIATGVLHNVGNVLNSVNVSTGVASERLQALTPQRLLQVADRICPEDAELTPPSELSPDERRKISRYLRELSRHWHDEQNALLAEVESAREGTDHIKSIVTKQQAYATTVGATESVNVCTLVDDALGFARAPLEQLGVKVRRRYADVQEIMLDRHRVLQILVNLVSNAKHALAASPVNNRQLVVHVQALDGQVSITVEDNGVGVRAEHRHKLFTHGFTTKPNGHGFGLHTSSLAARDVGGSLSFESAGPGQGASFCLLLPLSGAKRADAEAHDAA
jgi:signal transduction histidine kinase